MLVLQPRDRRLLQAVSQLKIVDKKQAQALGGFGSNARLNARLYKLTHAGFLRCHQMASDIGGKKSFYSLAPEAADGNASVSSWVSRNSAVFTAGAAGFVRRQLLANEVYIAAMKPSGRRIALKRWLSFEEPFAGAVPPAPDGGLEFADGESMYRMLLRVDEGVEPLRTWVEAAAGYASWAASGELGRLTGPPDFRVLMIAASEERMRLMRQMADGHGRDIFWFTTVKRLQRDGFWSPIWFRTAGEQGISLL